MSRSRFPLFCFLLCFGGHSSIPVSRIPVKSWNARNARKTGTAQFSDLAISLMDEEERDEEMERYLKRDGGSEKERRDRKWGV